MRNNIILMADAYKSSHWLQYPPGTEYVTSYIESRGGEYDEVFFVGLQGFLKEYLSKPFNLSDIQEAKEVINAMGVPFNEQGWRDLFSDYAGYLPIEISAVPEGTLAPVKVPLVKIVNTDPKYFWLTSYIETALLRAVWYPTTVSTISFRIKCIMQKFYYLTSDEPLNPCFLNDFGARGVSSQESAMIGGFGHLCHSFGTDNMESLRYANKFYNGADQAYSVAASEHSTMTSWGKDREKDAYENLIKQFLKPGTIVSCVSDSYDLFYAADNIIGQKLRQKIMASGGCFVVRPDSGDPVDIICRLISILSERFGHSVNNKGYKVLNPCVRIIQGDGVDERSIEQILMAMATLRWSAENIIFGMGGGLLQACDRDTGRWAMKCCQIITNVDGVQTAVPVFKDPVTDPGKASKAGSFTTVNRSGTIMVASYDGNSRGVKTQVDPLNDTDIMNVVFYNGSIGCEFTLNELRKASDEAVRASLT